MQKEVVEQSEKVHTVVQKVQAVDIQYRDRWHTLVQRGDTIYQHDSIVEYPHGKDNSVFICFAPQDNPKIAIAAYVENAGFGATWACPIASLMVEKYLTGETSRPDLEQRILETRLY